MGGLHKLGSHFEFHNFPAPLPKPFPVSMDQVEHCWSCLASLLEDTIGGISRKHDGYYLSIGGHNWRYI